MENKTFGSKLKEARISKGYTQKELASLIKAKHNSVSNWEHNQNRPDPDTIELLCGILDISPNYLLSTRLPSQAPLQPSDSYNFSQNEIDLIEKYRKCSHIGREKIDRYIDNIYELELAELAVTHPVEDPFAELRDEEAVKKYIVTPNPAAANE